MQAERIYLSGRGAADAVEWDFHCSSGRKSGEWTRIPVPSNWEQHGFGGYDYGHTAPDNKHDETGTYRTTFKVPESWKDRHVRLVFEGAMTETSIKINGKSLGTPNLGGYLPFRFPLDGSTLGKKEVVLKYGEVNDLEVKVAKKPSNRSLDFAERSGDYWVFGGIYRPVYLEVLPQDFIDRLAIDARADGRFVMDVFPQIHRGISYADLEKGNFVDEVEARILTLDGTAVGETFSAPMDCGTGRVRLETQLMNTVPWSPEQPNLYQVRVCLKKRGKTVFEKTETFGFRTFELRRQDGLYLNGKKLLIKGVNRNVFHPDTARAITTEQAWEDARQIKAMNANLVRSHMPPTPAFMEACNRLGLLVITELCNWQRPAMDTPVARNLVYELVAMYQNNPSVILWANGNEGGFNMETDQLYHLFDIQERPVIHPWTVFEGLQTKHYPRYDDLKKMMGPMIYLPTEFMHGLYDGGHGAGLADFWDMIRSSPFGAGGVLWCWADAAIARTDMDGKLDTAGNYSADGIVGPRREKEASYYTIREIWSPVQIPLKALPSGFDGTLPVENRYLFSSLDGCSLEWRLLGCADPFSEQAVSKVVAQGHMSLPAIAPGGEDNVKLPLPGHWKESDILVVRAVDAVGGELMQWSWPVRADAAVRDLPAGSKVEQTGPMTFKAGQVTWSFDPETGQLAGCAVAGRETGLGAGPVLYAKTEKTAIRQGGSWKVETSRNKDSVEVRSSNAKAGSSFSWRIAADGSAELSYAFAPIEDALAYCAVGFDLPDGAVASKRWLGDGPYRIWANRRQGPQFGLWETEYNDTITGETWVYPEFKGVFADVDWMCFNLRSGAQLLIQPEGMADVGVLRPKNAGDNGRSQSNQDPKSAVWEYPAEGGLFLFHKVPAIGTKFKKTRYLGPQSQPERLSGPIAGKVIFSVDASN